MAFNSDDFFVGMMAYFTVNDLRRHRSIRTTNPTRDKKPRPFLCYAEDDGESFWTPLTGTPNARRATIDRRWLRLPAGRFISCSEIIIGDCRSSFVGPVEAFAEASEKHDAFKGIRRPFLVSEGVDEVQRIVRSRGGLLPAAFMSPSRRRAA